MRMQIIPSIQYAADGTPILQLAHDQANDDWIRTARMEQETPDSEAVQKRYTMSMLEDVSDNEEQ